MLDKFWLLFPLISLGVCFVCIVLAFGYVCYINRRSYGRLEKGPAYKTDLRL
jgi:hypothetical protein